ncbi:DUF1800 domain-containing protein [Flavivirga eckloniae]|uniref:DUF1800 domain-containing protein n=1 Tax=Flavivirga eckloniae TaxID=1803846 RepID=A0A2K9PVM9_9FLAO|nr:DUF1800 family protein [Flavivirga eckloniae]AUP81125.1 DUF1800 domain-containing protein [Flavivirga eckloniae]
MKKHLLFIFLCLPIYFFSQAYSDYLGAGHSNGITVTSSSEQNRTDWRETASAQNTVNGHGLDARLFETSRFLAQATFGTDLNYIKQVAERPFEDWIDDQFEIASPSMRQLTEDIFNQALLIFVANGGNQDKYNGPDWPHFQYAWWQSNIGNDDLLRQRIALALSEIFVISWDSNLDSYGLGLGDYYDVLKDNAFGSFRNLLRTIALHPMMGGYLSHYNNPKSDLENNIHPDENFAREILQLFTIGLYELNPDGSYELDINGDRIPTYDNADIKEFAKIFTGLGPADIEPNPNDVVAEFGAGIHYARKDLPMKMYDEWHEPGEKRLLNGKIVPNGQTGMQDIEDAIDNLFNHKNTGPFIALRLIQQLVKSNPSPEYISRITNVFNNTNGVRGDMKAVIKAILLDDEARSCSWAENPTSGKLIEPMIRYFNATRQLDVDNKNGVNWNIGSRFYKDTGQAPLGSPSVFNFFLPDYVPNSEFADANLKGPEFQIHTSATCLAYLNRVIYWTNNHYSTMLDTRDLDLEDTPLNFDKLKYYAKDGEVLVNMLDKLFTRGQLSDETKRAIVTALEPIKGKSEKVDFMLNRVRMALYLILASPDYVILK